MFPISISQLFLALFAAHTATALPSTPFSDASGAPILAPRGALPYRRQAAASLYSLNGTPSAQEGSTKCLPDALKLPSGSKPLPPPTSGGKLAYVTIGRGVQLYNCATPSATPVPAGAIAALFDATCMASNSPDLFEHLPLIALQFPTPPAKTPSDDSLVGMPLLGRHYFTGTGNMSVPTFDLREGAHGNSGFVAAKVAVKVPAPTEAVKGRDGKGYGSVDWLQLGQKTAEGATFKEVYRVNTAGGKPPPSCGADSKIQVAYAAGYWLYA